MDSENQGFSVVLIVVDVVLFCFFTLINGNLRFESIRRKAYVESGRQKGNRERVTREVERGGRERKPRE